MISYAPFWKTMRDRGMTQYRLIKDHGIDNKLLCQLRHNGNITMHTVERLCGILECRVEDVVEIVRDDMEKSGPVNI